MSDFVEMHRPIIDARLEIHFATAMRKSVPESNPMLRIIAPRCRVRLGGEDEGKRKEKERMLRFVIIVSFASSLRRIEPQRQAASSSCGAYTGAHARPLGLHMRYFFCLSIRTHAPHARDVLAQSYVTMPRGAKRVRVQEYTRCTYVVYDSSNRSHMFGRVAGIGP